MSDELNCMLSEVDSWSFPWGKVANPLAQQCPVYGLKLRKCGNRSSLRLVEAASRTNKFTMSPYDFAQPGSNSSKNAAAWMK